MKPTPKVSTSLEEAKQAIKRQQLATDRSSESQISATSIRQKPFTEEELQACCQRYADRHGDKPVIAGMVKKAAVSQNKVTLTFENPALEPKIESEKVAILQELRDDLQNDTIELTYELVAEKHSARKGFGAEEKYHEIAEKFPLIAELRKLLDLTIEY